MSPLLASAGEIGLSPRAGDWLSGFGARIEPATGTHDPLMARAVLLSDGVAQLLVLSFDLVGLQFSTVTDLCRRIETASGIPRTNILVSCTHTHSGPASMRFRGLMGTVDWAWLEEALDRTVDLVSQLPGRLEPAQLAYGAAQVRGIGFNRQDESHPVDEECAAVAIDSMEGDAIATILHYATHAVILGPANLEFSADYPGAAATHIQRVRGGIGVFLQGACGDVDPVVNRGDGWGTGTFDDADRAGARIATAGAEALSAAPRTSRVALDIARAVVDIPLDPPPQADEVASIIENLEADIARAQADPRDRLAEETAKAMRDWSLDLQQAAASGAVPTSLPAEVFAARINDIVLLGVPFEVYGEIGFRVKASLRPLRTIVACYSNGLYGYLPTQEARLQGGYGPSYSHRWFPEMLTPIGDNADRVLASAAIALARSLGTVETAVETAAP